MRFIYNDGGRSDAGFKGSAGDCVTRAVAIATQQPYEVVYKAMASINASARNRKAKGIKSARNGVHVKSAGFRKYMASIGWVWHPTMQIGSGCKVHLTDGELPMGRLIVAVSRHYTTVIDGVIHDTHDPQRETHSTHPITPTQPMLEHEFTRDGKFAHSIQRRCVYGYWTHA